MIVNVSNLRAELLNFNKILKTYEENFLNLYNELSFSSSFWSDGHSIRFYRDIESDKLKNSIAIEEVNSVKNIYDYILSQYESLGEKIKFELNNRGAVLTKFDDYIKLLGTILELYEGLDLSFCPDVSGTIQREKSTLYSIKTQAIEIRNKTKSILDKILEIENEVKSKTSHINLDIVKEKEIDQYI